MILQVARGGAALETAHQDTDKYGGCGFAAMSPPVTRTMQKQIGRVSQAIRGLREL